MKILICGDVHAGKSTLIRRLVSDMQRPAYGFITRRLPEDPDGVSRVYLYDAASPTEERGGSLIIELKGNEYVGHPELMDHPGSDYLRNIPQGSLVLMDEIGTLESRSPEFQRAVFSVLDGDYDVLAAVKAQNTDFLRAVRKHPDCELYIITPENRDALYEQLCQEVKMYKKRQ